MIKKGTSENPVSGQCYICEWNDNGVRNVFGLYVKIISLDVLVIILKKDS